MAPGPTHAQCLFVLIDIKGWDSRQQDKETSMRLITAPLIGHQTTKQRSTCWLQGVADTEIRRLFVFEIFEFTCYVFSILCYWTRRDYRPAWSCLVSQYQSKAWPGRWYRNIFNAFFSTGLFNEFVLYNMVGVNEF